MANQNIFGEFDSQAGKVQVSSRLPLGIHKVCLHSIEDKPSKETGKDGGLMFNFVYAGEDPAYKGFTVSKYQGLGKEQIKKTKQNGEEMTIDAPIIGLINFMATVLNAMGLKEATEKLGNFQKLQKMREIADKESEKYPFIVIVNTEEKEIQNSNKTWVDSVLPTSNYAFPVTQLDKLLTNDSLAPKHYPLTSKKQSVTLSTDGFPDVGGNGSFGTPFTMDSPPGSYGSFDTAAFPQ